MKTLQEYINYVKSTIKETTEEMYWEMLEVLPPEDMYNGGFIVGEPKDTLNNGIHTYDCYAKKGDKYYTFECIKSEFRNMIRFIKESK